MQLFHFMIFIILLYYYFQFLNLIFGLQVSFYFPMIFIHHLKILLNFNIFMQLFLIMIIILLNYYFEYLNLNFDLHIIIHFFMIFIHHLYHLIYLN